MEKSEEWEQRRRFSNMTEPEKTRYIVNKFFEPNVGLTALTKASETNVVEPAKTKVTCTTSETSNKILDYLMKAQKQVGIHDAVFKAEPEPEKKPVEQEDPFDAMVKAFNNPEPAKTQTLEEYKAQFLKGLEKP
jgi:hypothetical protein